MAQTHPHHPSSVDHTKTLGDCQAPRSSVWAHRGTCSAGGQSSPGPADGPEPRPVPSAAVPGHRTPASLWGQSSITPRPGQKGLSSPLPASAACPPWTEWQQLWVLVASGVLGDPKCCASLPRNTQLCTASRGHQPPHSTAGTQQREGTRFCLLLLHFTGLKK